MTTAGHSIWRPSIFSSATMLRDLTAGLVVFLVALPLCLGIALASGVPLFAGLLAGIIGGIVVGSLSGSHTSVSGPAAGLTAVVAAQIATLGSFEAFLLSVFVAGFLQIGLGIARAGSLSAFFPSSVIKGLLAAIGAILVLKQIPHLVGHDRDPEGEYSFIQPDDFTTFSEFGNLIVSGIHPGAAIVGIISIVILVLWDRWSPFKKSVPGPLVVVLAGVLMQLGLARLGGTWSIGASHLVQIPIAETFADVVNFFTFPDFSQWTNSRVYLAAATLAIVASLETLLNLEAIDKLDPERRQSPSSRELVAQGAGNVIAGLIGGLPMTSVIVRSSVNLNAGAKTKLSSIFHGVLLLVCVTVLPVYLNRIPLAALAAILLVTGFKLASPKLFRQMWQEGPYQFLPFLATLVSILFTDLLVGILMGLGVSIVFILRSNLRRPVRRIVETHLAGEILHVELANQVSFLNRAALEKVFRDARPGTHLLIDASDTDYIDPDVMSLIRDFKDGIAPAQGLTVSLRGFRDKYQMHDEVQFADYSTRDLQDRLTPWQVLEILREGNRRFQTDRRLSRDFDRLVSATAAGQSPFAVVLGCMDSRVPTELVFDVGIGDIFSVRVAGNVIGNQQLASIEYAVKVVGVKLVLVLGHTRCGAVKASLELLASHQNVSNATGCAYLNSVVEEIEHSVDGSEWQRAYQGMSEECQEAFNDEVAKRNVLRSIHEIVERSEAVRAAIKADRLMVAGAIYDVKTGGIEILEDAVDTTT